MTKEPKFAAAYIRVSTEEQADLSPESQLEEIRKYARREGYVLLEDQIYADEGISGKKADKRPGFQGMIAAAKEKDRPFDVLLVWKFSRFARNQEESIFYKSILRSKCGVDVISVTEPIIAGPFGSLIERIIEWMDEFYSIRLSQEVKRSMTVNAANGKPQAPPPFGYTMDSGKLIINEQEAKYVRYIFDNFINGSGLYKIAKELNDFGVRTHRGNKFENRTVEYIIRNPVYIGKIRWNPTGRTRRDYSNENIITADAEHEPIVTQKVWDTAQHRMDEVKAQWGYKSRPTYELKGWTSGIVRCASCGATLVFSKPHYYKCNNYARGSCKHSQHIRADLLEQAIIERLETDLNRPNHLSIKKVYSNGNGGEQLSRYGVMLNQLQSKKNRLKDAYLSGVIELAEYAATKDELDKHEKEIQSEISRIESRADEQYLAENIRQKLNEALQTLKSPDATLQQKNNAAHSVIEDCTFDKTANLLKITYRYIF